MCEGVKVNKLHFFQFKENVIITYVLVTQLAECCSYKAKVAGSSPVWRIYNIYVFIIFVVMFLYFVYIIYVYVYDFIISRFLLYIKYSYFNISSYSKLIKCCHQLVRYKLLM